MAAQMFMVPQTMGTVLCCKCGIAMLPNPANMCVICLRSEVDITEGLQKHVVVMYCPNCDSYLQKKTCIKAQLESKELLAYCLSWVRDRTERYVRIVNAEFVWTEPHSKRLKVKMTVRKQVINGAILEQSYVINYVVQDHLCEACARVHANPDQWVSVVQLRQRVSHRRTFFYLEQMILKHDAASYAIKIKQMDWGIDFFFAKRSLAMAFMDFISKVAPVSTRHDKQLVSHDTKSNYYSYRYTFSVEICPICREDLVCLPPNCNLGPLVICTKVTDMIALLDPFTLKQSFLDSDQYCRTPFESLLTSRQLVKYYVFQVNVFEGSASKYMLADVEVARESDMETKFWVRTHLGHILKANDHALGYDLYGANTNNAELDKYTSKGLVLPKAILIKKCYKREGTNKCGKPRPWKLKSLGMEVDESMGRGNYHERMNSEYEEFLRDLEENPELRFNISLYRNREYKPSEPAPMSDGVDELDELFDDLVLNDQEDGEDI